MKLKYNIIFCIFGCATKNKYKNEILAINETWGKDATNLNLKILYFLGEENTDLIGDQYIYLKGVNNEYSSASHKHNLGLKYIYENYDCDYVFIIGSDVFVNPYNTISFCNKFNKDENLLIGAHPEKHKAIRKINNQELFFISGGGGYILTNGGLKNMYPYLENLQSDWENFIGKEKFFKDACDLSFCYYFTKYEGTIYNDSLPRIYHCNCNGKCCNIKKDTLISCHLMTPDLMKKFYLEYNKF
jgi:hypothetical protein